MAGFNEIGEGGLNNALSKRLSIPGGSPAPSLTPEIFPTLDVGVAWEELSFNQGWRRWWTTFTVASGGAGTFGRVLLHAIPGVVHVIEDISFYSQALTVYAVDLGYGSLAPLATAQNFHDFRDSRMANSGTGALVITSGTGAALTPRAMNTPQPAQQGASMRGLPVLLWGAGHMLIGGSVDNGAFVVSIAWSERAMTRNEFLG